MFIPEQKEISRLFSFSVSNLSGRKWVLPKSPLNYSLALRKDVGGKDVEGDKKKAEEGEDEFRIGL